MAGSVIDSLVVTLGLDSKAFASGIKGSTDELAGFTKRLAGMFLAVRGLEDVVGYFKDLHAQLAEIGFTSRNLGVAGTELKRLGEVSELFGGQMQDAASSIEGLQNSIFNLKYHGQISENLLMLQRFGVAYLDAAGKARKFRDIARDAAKVMDRRRAEGADQGELTQLAQSMGFQGGIASAIAQGSAGFEKAFDKATKDQKPLSERTIQQQVELSRRLTSLSEHTDALNSNILASLTPAIEAAVTGLRDLADKVLPMVVKAINELIDFFKNPPAWAKGIVDGIKQLAQFLGPGGTLLAALAALTLAVGAGGALMGVIGTLITTLGGIGLAVAAGVAAGNAIAKLPSGGLLDKINEKLLDWFGPGSSDAEKAAIRGSGPARGTIPRPPATPSAPRPPAGRTSTSTSTTNAPTVHIDKVEINTSSSTMSGAGSDMAGALQRKLLVSNADQGQG